MNLIFDPSASTISFNPGGASAPITFANLKDIDLPAPEVDDLDGTTRTTLANSTQLARSFSPGLMDNGEFSFQMQPGTAADILKVTDNIREPGTWTVNYNGVATATFEGYIKGYDWPDPLEEQAVMEVTVKVDGDVTVVGN